MDANFTGPNYTIGIEEELMILDAESLELVNAVESLLEGAHPERVKPELMESVLEIATSPQPSTAEAGAELRALAVERFELHAFVENAHDRREGRGVALEALGVEDLRHQAAIGHRRRIAVAKPPGAGKVREACFHLGEPVRDPVAVPRVHLLLGLIHALRRY